MPVFMVTKHIFTLGTEYIDHNAYDGKHIDLLFCDTHWTVKSPPKVCGV